MFMFYWIKGIIVKMFLKIFRVFIYFESIIVIIFVKFYNLNNMCYIEWIINCYLLYISNIYNYWVIIWCFLFIIILLVVDFKNNFKELKGIDGGGYF